VDFRLDKPITNKHSFAIKIRKKLPKTVIGKKIQEAVTLDGLKIVLEDDSWLLMRPSGTEPLLRTYAEAPSAEAVKKLLAFAKGLVEGK
jgi:phosphomannomutase